jgi:hypothetical protein
MAWRVAHALVALRAGVNTRWPHRDKASDGAIGDARHSANWSASDHNPWVNVGGVGVVRALDIDVDGIDAGWLAEQLRLRGAAGDHRLTGGGYVIYNRRITPPDFSRWVVYTGRNPHILHIHVSASRNRAGFDDGGGWPFLGGPGTTPPTTPTGRPTIQLGSTGQPVRDIQAHLKRVYPAYARQLVVDGAYGPATRAAVTEFQRRSGLTADGIVGPHTWSRMGFR